MKKYFFILFVLLVLMGCVSGPPINETPTEILTDVPTEIVKTDVPEPTASFTHTPTVTMSPTPVEELNTLNKIACPNMTCGVSGNTPNEGWVPYSLNGAGFEVWEEYNSRHVLGDWVALSWKTSFQKMEGGMYQQFDDLQPGAYYRANCWAFAFAGEPKQGAPSTGFVTIQMRIDPLGGTDPYADEVIKGIENANMLAGIREWFVPTVGTDLYEPTDIYDPYTIYWVATQPEATLFMHAESDFAYDQSSVTIDSCEMHAQGWIHEMGQ